MSCKENSIKQLGKINPLWYEFDRATIIENGFRTMQKANESKQIAIKEYQSKGFEIHELKW